MTQLIVFKDMLKKIYAKYDFLIIYLARFIFSLTAGLVIIGQTGYSAKLSNKLLIVLVAAVCTFLPAGATALIMVGIILFELYSLSLEYALIAAVVFALMFLVYFIFSTGTAFILLLTPICFVLKIPYAIPIIVGLTVGIKGIFPVLFGIYTYFLLDFTQPFSEVMGSYGTEAIIQKIVFIIDNTIMNKEMMVLFIVFAATIILVSVVKSLSMNYSWLVAVGTGVVVEAILVIMSYVMLDLNLDIASLVVGMLITAIIGCVLDFFIMSVDYQRTEHVQFEDDDYYYYVKAIPKFTVPVADVKVKKINTRKEEVRTSKPRIYEPEPEEQDDDDMQRAYEQDISNLDDEE